MDMSSLDAASPVHVTPTLPRHLSGVHGLRGIAAMAVVAFHLHHLSALALPNSLTFIGFYGGMGVHMFFVISGFSLLYGHQRRGPSEGWIPEFYLKRLFRILPLYYAVLLFDLLIFFPVTIATILPQYPMPDGHAVLIEVFFARALLGVEMSSIVWAGWTLHAEMVFYAVLPLVILMCRSVVSVFVVCAALVALAIFSHVPLSDTGASLSAIFNLAGYFFVFFFGWPALLLLRRIAAGPVVLIRAIQFLAVAALVATMCGLPELLRPYGLDVLLWATVFALLVASQAVLPWRLIDNRFLDFAGERSYSLYLLHPIIIVYAARVTQPLYGYLAQYIAEFAFIPCAFVLLFFVFAAAEVTYRLVEAPGIRMGARIIRRRRQRLTIM